LHSLLAKRLFDSPAAIELLRDVQLLQYFDMAGLVKSVGEVSEALYQRTQGPRTTAKQEVNHDSNSSLSNGHIVLIQGLGETVSATQRRSGLVQANALLAGLMRNLMQLSRQPMGVMVLVDTTIDIQGGLDMACKEDPKGGKRSRPGLELVSVFSGPNGEKLMLTCGGETTSQVVEVACDVVMLVHDGLGRTKPEKGRMEHRKMIVEVTKDRVGGTTGLWSIWATEEQG
jgi:hypothetical protein